MISDVPPGPEAQHSQLISDENYPQTVDEVHISNDFLVTPPIEGATLRGVCRNSKVGIMLSFLFICLTV